MYILLMGPPGAGKGTQGPKLGKQFEIPVISTGDMFRAAVNEGTALGQKAKEFMDAGKLVPDEVTVGIVRDRLKKDDCDSGFILDGFPRTIDQAIALDEVFEELQVNKVHVIDISMEFELLLKRITGRRICKLCGATYHIENLPSKIEDKCDLCDGVLYQRADDVEATVQNRLNVYENQTKPLIDYYDARGFYKEINGNQDVEKVYQDIVLVLKD